MDPVTTPSSNEASTTTLATILHSAIPDNNSEVELAILPAAPLPDYSHLVDRVFIGCLICLVVVANVLMGCELDLNVVCQTIKRPIAPAIGFFTQFALMPLIGYSIAMLVLSTGGQYLLAFGLFVTGCSPGGGASNYWTLLLNGNANLSITMTFISTIAALVMMPFWIGLLGPSLLQSINSSTTVHIPYSKIIASLISLILPLLVGLAIARFRSNLAARMRRLMRPFIISVILFIILFGVLNNLRLLRLITWRILLAGLLLPWSGFMFGCFVSILMNQKAPEVTAIAIETGVQNTGIAIMMLKLTFPGVSGDMASLLPIVVACNTPTLILLAYFICRISKNRRAANERRACALTSAVVSNKTDCQLRIMDGEKYQPIGQILQSTQQTTLSSVATVKS